MANAVAAPGTAPELPKGSIALFDYRVLHRGLPNEASEPRPVMYVTYSRPWYRDVDNFPADRLFPAGASLPGPGAEGLRGFGTGPAHKASAKKSKSSGKRRRS